MALFRIVSDVQRACGYHSLPPFHAPVKVKFAITSAAGKPE